LACQRPILVVHWSGDCRELVDAPHVLRVPARDGPALGRRPALSPGSAAPLTYSSSDRRRMNPPTPAEDVTMSSPPANRRAPARTEAASPAVPQPSPAPPAPSSRFRRLAARVGAAVRSAHSASVPF